MNDYCLLQELSGAYSVSRCLAEIPKSCMNSTVDKGSVEDTTENIRDGDGENLYTLVHIVLS